MTDGDLWPNLLDSAGRLRIDAVNQLSMADLAAWVRAVLRSEHVATGADRDDSPVDFLTRAYHQLDPFVRQAFQDALLGLLGGLARARDRWEPGVAEDLLLLIGAVCRGTSGASQAVDLLLFIVDAEHGVEWPDPDMLPLIALRALIALGHRSSPEFWLRQHRRRGARAAGPVLRGLALWNLASAFAWIEDHGHDAAALSALRAALPLFVEQFGPDALHDHLARLALRLSRDDAASLARTCSAIGLDEPLRTDAAASPARAQLDLALLAQHLNVSGMSQLSDPSELQEHVTQKLHTADPASDEPRYVHSVLLLATLLLEVPAACQALKRLRTAWHTRSAAMSRTRREALARLIEELDRTTTAPEISFELQALAYMLRNESMNITAELARIVSSALET